MLRKSDIPALVLLAAGSVTVLASLAGTQGARADTWSDRKCALYTLAWTQLTAGGAEGVSERFLADHEAFLASGCRANKHVCPRRPRELELADTLSMMAVAEGMTGSFLPFSCRAG